jgi:hypothetical protein
MPVSIMSKSYAKFAWDSQQNCEIITEMQSRTPDECHLVLRTYKLFVSLKA